MSPRFLGATIGSSMVEDALYGRLAGDFLSEAESRGPPDWDPLEGFSPALLAALEAAHEEIAGLDMEHVRIFGPDGALIQHAEGSRRSVGFDPSHHVCGAVAVHNHPQGTPPSDGDLFTMVACQFLLVRILTRQGSVFDLSPRTDSLGDVKSCYSFLDEQSWAVAEDCIRREGLSISETERFSRRQHALMMDLARRGLVCYARGRWTNKQGSTASGG